MKMRTRTDTAIQRAVLEELRLDPQVEEQYLGVTVDHGVVTLAGLVSDYTKRLAAEDAARRAEGVVAVVNDIQVKLAGD